MSAELWVELWDRLTSFTSEESGDSGFHKTGEAMARTNSIAKSRSCTRLVWWPNKKKITNCKRGFNHSHWHGSFHNVPNDLDRTISFLRWCLELCPMEVVRNSERKCADSSVLAAWYSSCKPCVNATSLLGCVVDLDLQYCSQFSISVRAISNQLHNVTADGHHHVGELQSDYVRDEKTSNASSHAMLLHPQMMNSSSQPRRLVNLGKPAWNVGLRVRTAFWHDHLLNVDTFKLLNLQASATVHQVFAEVMQQ